MGRDGTVDCFIKEHAETTHEKDCQYNYEDARDVLDVQGVKQLAALPGLPELRAQLLCLLQTPATQLVRLLDTPGTQVARVVDARREQQEQE